ncbi:MAG TPA: tRNA (adenosine(37)-N6)-threonylcarbamoyltransferase complex dimerization subunit type 1 TsaB [Chitinophagaceae bacterium]|nr:tRNA (adenosine(37)-N6)-threonylcarbamoyltransferase complex dimerization subunit type 1 TsaB [Chitinophagaceae bacterium]
MAILLHIDTALETASVCLSDNEKVIGLAINEKQKDHAAWLHPAILDLVQAAGLTVSDIEAIGISIGPGSYTGLRIGLSAAKGLCYALNIPLITVDTLYMMAHAIEENNADFICPLIDARRMEVFAAVYNKLWQEIVQPSALIVDNKSFFNLLLTKRIAFCGSGSKKLQSVLCHDNAMFTECNATAAHLAPIVYDDWMKKKFSDLAYTEPFYIKEFYTKPH